VAWSGWRHGEAMDMLSDADSSTTTRLICLTAADVVKEGAVKHRS
jgi:hypothetical protein